MRSQIEKNKEAAMDKIEEYSEKPFSDSVAEHLSVYFNAYNAMCMRDKSGENGSYAAAVKTADKPEPTMALDGDTEFERVIMTIPPDTAHMVKITHIFNKHLEGLAAVNRRAYNSIIEQLKEVAKS